MAVIPQEAARGGVQRAVWKAILEPEGAGGVSATCLPPPCPAWLHCATCFGLCGRGSPPEWQVAIEEGDAGPPRPRGRLRRRRRSTDCRTGGRRPGGLDPQLSLGEPTVRAAESPVRNTCAHHRTRAPLSPIHRSNDPKLAREPQAVGDPDVVSGRRGLRRTRGVRRSCRAGEGCAGVSRVPHRRASVTCCDQRVVAPPHVPPTIWHQWDGLCGRVPITALEARTDDLMPGGWFGTSGCL